MLVYSDVVAFEVQLCIGVYFRRSFHGGNFLLHFVLDGSQLVEIILKFFDAFGSVLVLFLFRYDLVSILGVLLKQCLVEFVHFECPA